MKQTLRLAVSAAMFGAVLFLFAAPGVPSVQANIYSPEQCDIDRKYHCTYIDYDIYPGATTWYVTHARLWQGATDGGAERWQLLFADDYYWNGSSWVLSQHRGETAWLTNYFMGDWWSYNGDNWMTGGGVVGMQHQFYTCNPSPCRYWSDPVNWHYLQ